jgi:16S rRNA (cytosine967-C5)-methyltransferase
VLRGSQRQQQRLRAEIARTPSAHHAHPQWLIDAIRASNPDCWAEILEANNQRPPMALRVNARLTSREDYLRRLAEAGIEATPTLHSQQGLRLQHPVAVEALPGFGEGLVSVQDEAAQLAASLMDVAAGQRVLDACAAPGGKCAHLLETVPDRTELVALDSEPARVIRLQETLRRLHLEARVIAGDALTVGQWWNGQQFDRVLVDAPCSATGVIRRHPDIKALRTAQDIVALSATQGALLQALWPLVSCGGKLLYVTCSVLRPENAGVVEAFLGSHADARIIGIDAGWGRNAGPGRQIMPGENGMDGFFYALLGKD